MHCNVCKFVGSLQTGSQWGRKKNSEIESVIPWAKWVGVGVCIRERSKWDPVHSLVTRLLLAHHANPRLYSASSL